MKTLIAAVSLAFVFVSPALLAQTSVKIPADKPVASITFPEGWKASAGAETITASAEDGSALIDVIVTRPDMLGPSNDKAWALLKVKPDFDSYKDTKSTLNGMNVVTVTDDGRTSDGKTMKITLTALEVTKDQGVMLIQRGEGMAEYADEITAILNSVAAAK
ncbi:MAG TPA: hypothetical protein VJU77_09680 [Chthoniobacterales bacterium]|nr:hypothetical protein [Chthoniobacterales bacterium]